VGLTVVAASATLMVLIFLMSGTGGWFTSKIRLRSYVGHAGGLREGAPVRLAGVDIGNVTTVRIVNGKPLTPVEIMMKVNTKYKLPATSPISRTWCAPARARCRTWTRC
jgi:phospholipid/cholesterol/gamma-HCH transport system substrate-binding protein